MKKSLLDNNIIYATICVFGAVGGWVLGVLIVRVIIGIFK